MKSLLLYTLNREGYRIYAKMICTAYLFVPTDTAVDP